MKVVDEMVGNSSSRLDYALKGVYMLPTLATIVHSTLLVLTNS